MSTFRDQSIVQNFDSNGNAMGDDRSIISIDEKVTVPWTTNKSRPLGRLSTTISPPPLLRRRMGSELSSPYSDQPRATSICAQSLHPRGVKRSLSSLTELNVHQIDEQVQRECRSEYFKGFSSFSTPPAYQETVRQHYNLSSRYSTSNRSDASSRTTPSNKRKCRTCGKSSITKYNPIISCPRCNRRYHDSCRKPPLNEGLNPNRWICSKCSSSKLGHTTVDHIATPPTPIASSVLSEAKSLLSESNRSERKSLQAKTVSFHSVPIGNDTVCQTSGTRAPANHPAKSPHFGSLTPLDAYKNAKPLLGNTMSADRAKRQHSITPNFATVVRNLSSDAFRNPAVASNGSKDFICEQTKFNTCGRMEVPDTPLHGSSQASIPEKLSIPPQWTPAGAVDGSVLSTPSQPEENRCLTTLCSVCLKQRVLADSKTKPVKWYCCPSTHSCPVIDHYSRHCRNRLFIVETGTVEIPETPDNASSYDTRSPDSLPCQKPLTLSKLPAHLTEPILSVLSEPDIQLSELRAVQKRDFDQMAYRPKESHLSSSGIDLHRPFCNPPDDFEQIIIPESKREAKADLSSSDLCGTQACNLGNKMPFSHTCVDGTIRSTPLEDISSIANRANRPNQRHIGQIRVISHEHRKARRLCVDFKSATDAAVRSSAMNVRDGPDSIREKIRLALLAANGTRLSTSQIIEWIEEYFPRLDERGIDGASGLVSVLSDSPEFHGVTVSGTRENQKLWGFVNARVRARYRQEYFEHQQFPTAVSKQAGLPSSAETKNLGQRRNSKDAQSQTQALQTQECVLHSTNAPPIDATTTAGDISLARPTLGKVTEGNDSLFMPFERSSSRQRHRIFNLYSDGEREPSFHFLFVQQAQSPIETMTEKDKLRRINEIKARPSRKAIFGSENRLAHVRRYRRQDIHDESAGAWTPNTSDEGKRKPKVNMHSLTVDANQRLTLRQVLGLPNTAIPMNDGVTELAFRDGSMVNGRLPRPRQIYKVGKLFGGELTVRTS